MQHAIRVFDQSPNIAYIFQDNYHVFSLCCNILYIIRFKRAILDKYRGIFAVETMMPQRKRTKRDDATIHSNVGLMHDTILGYCPNIALFDLI